MKILLVLALLAPLSDSRHEVYRRCVECKNLCHRSDDRAECARSCYRFKASDCRQNGHGPGPEMSCSCT